MEPHKLILSALLFSFFIVGGVYIMYGMSADDDGLFETYGITKGPITTDLENLTADKYKSIYNDSDKQKDALEGQQLTDTLGWEGSIGGSYKVLLSMVRYFSTIGALIQGVARIFGLPRFIPEFAMIAVLIFVVFIIVYMIFRFQPRG